MRVFCEYTAEKKKDDSNVDELLPEISKFCFHLRGYYDLMGETTNDEERDSYEFVVEQLFLLSKVFDFSDEVGRRSMFTMLRTVLFLLHKSPHPCVNPLIRPFVQVISLPWLTSLRDLCPRWLTLCTRFRRMRPSSPGAWRVTSPFSGSPGSSHPFPF